MMMQVLQGLDKHHEKPLSHHPGHTILRADALGQGKQSFQHGTVHGAFMQEQQGRLRSTLHLQYVRTAPMERAIGRG